MEDLSDLPVYISYGGGVQTFGMLLMVKNGLIAKPKGLIFSDTKAEYPETYSHIEEIVKPMCEDLEIPFITLVHEEGLIEGYKSNNSIPLAGFRSCTMKYKVDPIRKFLRCQIEGKRYGKARVRVLIGISTDEARRAISPKDQRPKWIRNEYPFLEMDFSRRQIMEYIENDDYKIPRKSGCYICPYHGLKGFVDLKINYPDLMKIAIDMEDLYFEFRPEHKHGFLADSQIKLRELSEIPSLYSFVDQLPYETRECDSGGCFL